MAILGKKVLCHNLLLQLQKNCEPCRGVLWLNCGHDISRKERMGQEMLSMPCTKGSQYAHHENNIGDGRNLLSRRQCSGSHARLMARHMPASFHYLWPCHAQNKK